MTIAEAEALSSGEVVLITRRFAGVGADPASFGFRWFLPSIVRYRKPLAQVAIASLFVQAFALLTPIFFQLIVDKVLVHKGFSTLAVIVVGMLGLGAFESLLQFLRAYTLSHTTNRIDVELGRRLFHHLFRLPLSYFETRAAGQTVARVRELETIRSFLTGQGLTSLLDLVFTAIFFVVMFLYSAKLTLIVIGSIPLYVLVAGADPTAAARTHQREVQRGRPLAAVPGRSPSSARRRSRPPASSRSCSRSGRSVWRPMSAPRSTPACSARSARKSSSTSVRPRPR